MRAILNNAQDQSRLVWTYIVMEPDLRHTFSRARQPAEDFWMFFRAVETFANNSFIAVCLQTARPDVEREIPVSKS